MNFDPFVCEPRSQHLVPVSSDACHDLYRQVVVNAMVITDDGRRLVMSDYLNAKVKVATLNGSSEIEAATPRLQNKPLAVCLLPGNRKAAATGTQKTLFVIYLTLSGDVGELRVSTSVRTARQYYGIGAAVYPDGVVSLVVCRQKDEGGEAGVDVITEDGLLLHSMANNCILKEPRHLAVMGRDILVLDTLSRKIFQIRLDTGHAQMVDPPDVNLCGPCHLAVDPAGNVFIADREGGSVLVVSRDCKRWRRLLTAAEDSGLRPVSVCVTGNGIVVSWYGRADSRLGHGQEDASMITVYELTDKNTHDATACIAPSNQ